MNIKCMIIDDEPLARNLLKTYMARLPELTLVAECASALEAITKIKESDPDIVFCDIKMPGLNGLDFLRAQEKLPAVVITSAYEQYAVDGFDIGVTDYLVKPFRFERFVKAIGRADRKATAHKPLSKEKNVQPASEALFIKVDGTLIKLRYTEIIYLEACGNYTLFHTGTKRYITKEKISAFENRLEKKQFLRIHKSYIVSLARITAIAGNKVILDDTSLPIGNFYKKDFMRLKGF